MIKCQHCGNKYVEGTRYCLGCGRVIDDNTINNNLHIKLFNSEPTAKINDKWDYRLDWLSKLLIKILTWLNQGSFNQQLLINKYLDNPNLGCPKCHCGDKVVNRPSIMNNTLSIVNLGYSRDTYLKCSNCNWKHYLDKAEEERYKLLKFDNFHKKPFPMISMWR